MCIPGCSVLSHVTTRDLKSKRPKKVSVITDLHGPVGPAGRAEGTAGNCHCRQLAAAKSGGKERRQQPGGKPVPLSPSHNLSPL